MSSVVKLSVDPVLRMIHDVKNHLHVVGVATELVY